MATDPVTEIRSRIELEDLVGEKVALKRAGRNLKGLCPFHQEKTPSFVVFPESQNFHCFGCGKGGDLFSFYMEIEGVDFREALHDLAERAGVSLDSAPAILQGPDPLRQQYMELHRIATAFYANALKSEKTGEKGRSYLFSRGMSEQAVERFHLGLAPDGWDFLAKQFSARGIDLETAADAGLLQRRDSGGYYDRFRDRIMFPIEDANGDVVGFGGRAFGEQQPKYLNSPQSPIFDKSSLLYGLSAARDAIRSENRVVFVEGYMDVIAAHEHGYPNVVGAMGTALTEAQVDLVKRLTKRIVLALDADAAGQLASFRAVESLQSSLDHIEDYVPDLANQPRVPTNIPVARAMVRIAHRLDSEVHIARLDAGSDPDSLIRQNPDQWERLIDEAQPYMGFVIEQVVKDADPNDAKSKRRAIDTIGPFLQQIGDPVERRHYVQHLSRLLDQPYSDVLARVEQSRTRAPLTELPYAPASGPQRQQARTEDHVIALGVRYNGVVADLIDSVPDAVFNDSRNRQVLAWLIRETSNRPQSEDTILANLDEPLATHASSILSRFTGRPSPMPAEIREELLQTVMKLQREQLEVLSAHLRSELETAQSSQDQDSLGEIRSFLERLPLLHQQLYPRRSPYFRDTRTTTEGHQS
ncbi:DNA primase [soil metagenome]